MKACDDCRGGGFGYREGHSKCKQLFKNAVSVNYCRCKKQRKD